MRAVFPGNTRCIARKTVPRRGKAPLFGCFGSFQICPSMDSGEEMILELISKVAFSSGVWYFMEEKFHSFLILCLSTQRSERIVYLRWFHWRLRRQSLLLGCGVRYTVTIIETLRRKRTAVTPHQSRFARQLLLKEKPLVRVPHRWNHRTCYDKRSFTIPLSQHDKRF